MAVLWILTLAVTLHQGETSDTTGAADLPPPLPPVETFFISKHSSPCEAVRLAGCLVSASARVSLHKSPERVRVRAVYRFK